MNKTLRKTVIAGNWKMNKTVTEEGKFISELIPLVKDANCDVVVCVPFICLQDTLNRVKGTNIKVGAQNMHFEKSGAYTGEISADMLVDLGVEYVIIGHSERRQYFNETDVTVNKKVLKAIEAGLKPIICVGELLEQREQGITEEIVSLQTKIALMNVPRETLSNIIIAYEPVWAIGTGKTATSEQADEVNGIIRNTIKKLYDDSAAESVTIQYGGSMNVKNASELLSKYHVDGGLIGGASLKAVDFESIIKAASC
jgi:triosephosphate isomerase